MPTDAEIARAATLRPIAEIASKLGLEACDLHPYGRAIAKVDLSVYGAAGVELTSAAERDLRDVDRLGYAGLPVCIAKTQSSLSDDPRRRGRPRDFEVTVRRVLANSGAGFLVVITGEMLRMPGLPQTPLAESIDLDGWTIVGLQ